MDRIIKRQRKKDKRIAFWGMLRSEGMRIFQLKNLLLTLLLVSLLIGLDLFNNYEAIMYISVDTKILYFYELYHRTISNTGFCILFLIPVSLPIVTNLCRDIRQKVVYFYATRSNIGAYILVKLLVGIVFTFLMTFLAFALFTGLGMWIFPVVDPELFSYSNDIYLDLLEKSPFRYFMLRNLYLSLTASLFSAVGMVVTVLIPNLYIAVLSPFLSFNIIDDLILILKSESIHTFTGIITGWIRNGRELGNAVLSMVLYFLFLYMIVGYLYYRLMEWRCYGERS